MYGVTSIPIMYADQATGKAKAFFENYQKRFDKAPSEVAQKGYFSADLPVIALEKAGKQLTVDNFIKALEGIQGYQHPFGGPVVNFGPQNTSVPMNRYCSRFRMENGFLQPDRKKFSVTNNIKFRCLSPS